MEALSRVSALFVFDDFGAGPFGPDHELLDGGGSKGIGGGNQDLFAGGGGFGGQFPDGGGFADAVDPHDHGDPGPG